MYEITLKYQGWFYTSQLHRPDLFTALGAVLDSHEHMAVQWYRVRSLVSEEGAPAPLEKAEEANPAKRALSLHESTGGVSPAGDTPRTEGQGRPSRLEKRPQRH